jgi:hypothetical protein
VQIIKKHWRQFLPGAGGLDRDQKREFLFGWLTWFGADIIAIAAAILNLIWVPFVVFQAVAIPDALLTLPILAAFFISLAHFASSYRVRVAIPYRQMVGAMVMAMSVQWTVASAAVKAALNYFHRTRKGNGTILHAPFAAMPEAVLGMLMLVGSVTVYATNFHRYLESDLLAAVLLIQSLPFLSALALVWFERSRTGKNQSWFLQHKSAVAEFGRVQNRTEKLRAGLARLDPETDPSPATDRQIIISNSAQQENSSAAWRWLCDVASAFRTTTSPLRSTDVPWATYPSQGPGGRS